MTITRLDISFVVQQVSQFMHTPCHLHLVVACRIIKYLHGTPSRGLCFLTGSLRLVAYKSTVGCHSIREALDSHIISLPYISTTLQIADVFTKAMTRQRHQFLVGKLMLLDRPASI